MENTNLLDEAYKKILASEELQLKFMEAVKENKLDAFLKEENIDATPEEVKEYLTKKFKNTEGELSKEELDMAAGGKGTTGWVILSIVGLGIGCAVSAIAEQTSGFCIQ